MTKSFAMRWSEPESSDKEAEKGLVASTLLRQVLRCF